SAMPPPPPPSLFPYTTLFRSVAGGRFPPVADLLRDRVEGLDFNERYAVRWLLFRFLIEGPHADAFHLFLDDLRRLGGGGDFRERSEEHTSELQSRRDLVCRLL